MSTSPSPNKHGTSTSPTLTHTTKCAFLNWRSTWIVLIVGLMITATATLYMKSSVENVANLEFTTHCNEIANKITERLDDHARILQSGAALFNASGIVTREEWRIFNKAQKVEKQLPGIQGIGFSLLIPQAELPRHIQKIHREGFPQYKLKPDGDREIYSSIIYLEPFSGRNLRAFGYDMLSEPVRKAAMERARDTDNAALSGKVVLVQETSADIQAGTLMYVPVYRKGMPIETIEQRRAAIYGWVYSPYRMNDLMQGIISNIYLEKEKQVRLQVFDGMQPSIQALLFDSHSALDKPLRPDGRFTRQIPVDFNGQYWTLHFTKTGGVFSTVDYNSVWLTMFGGILITLLLFSLIRALLNTRAKACTAENLAADLLVSERKYQSLFNNAQVALFRTRTPDGKLLEINDRYAQMAGYSNVNDCLAEFNASGAWADPDGRKIFLGVLQEKGFVTNYETSIIRRDGTHLWILFSATIYPEQGFIEGSIADITSLKQTEESLLTHRVELTAQNEELRHRQAELDAERARYFDLYDLAPIGYFTLSDKDLILEANLTAAAMLGIARGALIKQRLTNLILPEDQDIYYLRHKLLIETGAPQTWEMRMLKRDGLFFWARIEAIKAQGTAGKLVFRIVMSDISENKKAELDLNNLNYRYELAVRSAGIGVWDWDIKQNRLVWDDQMYKLYGIREEDFTGAYEAWINGLHPDDVMRSIEVSEKACSGEMPYETEFRIIWPNGEIRHLKAYGRVQRDEQGRPLRMTGVNYDITAGKQAEEKIKTSLHEKETLLKEIHHRVKNNLQIISSLLMLQSRYIEDEKVEEVFKECQDRIMAMASVHSLLYKSQDFAAIDFGEYIRETATQLFRSYKTGSAVISLIIHAENVMLPIDTAIPCGLIINELVTNALKYAFQGIGKGEIKIDMKRTESGVNLLFEDNGIGFPEDSNFYNTETLGLKLVHLLVKQLDGSIERNTSLGTRYSITFKMDTHQER